MAKRDTTADPGQMGLFEVPARAPKPEPPAPPAPAPPPAPEPARPRVRTVSELTQEIKSLLEGQLGAVWITGEISNFRRHGSGHCYFSLKDEGAQLSAACFRTQARRLRFDVTDGLEVLVRGRIEVYPPHGKYQLIVDHMEPKGLGALQAAFDALKKRLAAEGLFDEGRKRPVPRLPRRIGVVTSPTGAALRDFLRVLHRRHPGLSVLLAPARVQGELAPAEVARQIRRLDRTDVDVIVVTRGGGSMEDLWAFNEEVVARAIAECATPLVSAVGHEVDFTIADFVADVRCPTPSAAAERVAPELPVLRRELRDGGQRLVRGMERDLYRRRHEIGERWRRVGDPRRVLSGHRLALEALRARVGTATVARLRREERALSGHARSLRERHPRATLSRRRAALDALSVRLSRAAQRDVGASRQAFAGLAGTLEALSPLKVLARGYGLVRRDDGLIVTRAADVAPGETVSIDVREGRIRAEVTSTEDE